MVNWRNIGQKVWNVGGFVKRNPRVILVAGACGALLVAYKGLTGEGSERIYDGSIAGYSVGYNEGEDENRLRIKDGSHEYGFVDSEGKTDIDWKANRKPQFERDRLERVEIYRPGRRVVVTREDIDLHSITGEQARKLFDSSDKTYALVRGAVRQRVRGNYVDGMNEVLQDIRHIGEEFAPATQPASPGSD